MKKIASLAKRLDRVEACGSDEEVRKLKSSINNLEQYGRLLNLEVHGLKEHENEDLLLELNKIGESLGLESISSHDVHGLHRLPSKPGKVPTVIVRFVSRTTREKWLAKNALLRERKEGIYFQENMTTKNRRVFWSVKNRADETDISLSGTGRVSSLSRNERGTLLSGLMVKRISGRYNEGYS